MATEQNQLTPTPDGANLPSDIPADAPTAEDGGLSVSEEPASPAAQPSAKKDEDEVSPGTPQHWRDEKREAIFAQARANRQAQAEQQTPFAIDAGMPHVGDDEEAPIDAPAVQPPQQQQPPQQRPLNGNDPALLNQRIRTVVNGVETEITVEDAVRNYQKAQAADQYLNEARQTLQEVKQLQRQAQTRPADGNHQPQGQEFTEPEYVPSSVRRNTSEPQQFNASELIEKIQLGTPGEAAEALEQFVASKMTNANPQADYQRVLTVLEDQSAERAVQAFAAANPEIHDPMFQDVATKFIHRGMVDDLLKAGMSLDDLRAQATSPEALTRIHKQARISRLPSVRSTEQLLNAGYQAAKDWRSGGNQQQQQRQPNPAPAQQMQQRVERKDALQHQPAARRLAPAITQQPQAKSVDASRSDAIARMREGRRQTV